MRAVVLSRLVHQDIAEIAAYLRTVAGLEIARTVVLRLNDCWAKWSGNSGANVQSWDQGSIASRSRLLFLRYSPDRVEIARVLHGRRDLDSAFDEQ